MALPLGEIPPRRVWSERRGKRGGDGETKLVEQVEALRGVPRINGGPRGPRWKTPPITPPPLGTWGKFWGEAGVFDVRLRGTQSLVMFKVSMESP